MPRRARIAVGNYQRNQLTGSEAFMLEIGQRIAERILFAHAEPTDLTLLMREDESGK